jgi:hypothetical protein
MTSAAAIRRLLAVWLSVILFASAGARADESAFAEARSVIEGQLDAFRAGDDERAYSFASPGIRQIFPTRDLFMSMVMNAYRPVWRPQSHVFGPARAIDGSTVVQTLHVIGPDGREYEAVYTLQRQADGLWKIAAVTLRKLDSLGA